MRDADLLDAGRESGPSMGIDQKGKVKYVQGGSSFIVIFYGPFVW